MFGKNKKVATLENYQLVATLGSGFNSKVKLGYDTKTNQYAAVKIIKHQSPNLNLDTIKKEIEVLMHIKHENIVNLIDYYPNATYYKKNGHVYKVIAIIMEVLPNGELFEYLSHYGKFSESMARTLFLSILNTIEFCHGKGITHRDLKPENLIFDSEFNLKVADFGFATLISGTDSKGSLKTVLGTENYMAPEILLEQNYCGPAVDLFALGTILFIMVTGYPPFRAAHPSKDARYKLLCANEHGKFWEWHEKQYAEKYGKQKEFDEGFKDLINSMLSLDPVMRLTISEIRSHPWALGKTVTHDFFKNELGDRRSTIDDNLKKQKDAKKKRQLMGKVIESYATAQVAGFKPFRAGDEVDEKQQELLKNLEAERELADYQNKEFRPASRMYSVLTPKFIFKFLCGVCQSTFTKFTLSEDKYKIKGKLITSSGDTCELKITVSQADDETCCIDFFKTSGDILAFYDIVNDIKKSLPSVQEEESEQNNSTA